MSKFLRIALVASALAPTAAGATVTVDIHEVGSDVTATASGSLDLEGMNDVGPSGITYGMEPAAAHITVGAVELVDAYVGLSGPSNFGAGGYSVSSTTVGDPFALMQFAILGVPGDVFVPVGYSSGSNINGSATWSNQTFATLGLTPGTYTFTLPHDSIILNIGDVPEPSTWAMMLLGFGAIGSAMRRSNRRQLRTRSA